MPMTRIDGANHLKQGFKSFKEDKKKAKNSNIDMKQKFYLIVSNMCFNLQSWPSKQEKS
jgi:hypothetical protein